MAIIRYRNQVGQWQAPYYLYPKMWDGTQWVYVKPKFWDSGWKDFSYTGLYTVNVGTTSAFFGGSFGINISWLYYGYAQFAPTEPGIYGTLVSPFGTINNQTITSVYYLIQTVYGTTNRSIILRIPNAQNTGWNNLTIGASSYARTNASFDTATGTWSWVTDTVNPFGTIVGVSVGVTIS